MANTYRVCLKSLLVAIVAGFTVFCICRTTFSEESANHPAKPLSSSVFTAEQKNRQEVLEDIYDTLENDPEEVSKYLGLRGMAIDDHQKYFLGNKPLEGLDIKDLEKLRSKGWDFENKQRMELQEEERDARRSH